MGVFVDLPEGSLTTQTKEVCIEFCKNKKEVVPLSDTEKIISHLVELSPHGNPLCELATLCLPIEEVPNGFERFLRWTPTQSGEKACWSDVHSNEHSTDEDQTAVELKDQKAKVYTKEFGIFCIISRKSNKKLEPLRERSTSDAIKAFGSEFGGDISTTSVNRHHDLNNTSSHQRVQREKSTKGPSLIERITNKFKRSDKQESTSIGREKSNISKTASKTSPIPPVNSSAAPPLLTASTSAALQADSAPHTPPSDLPAPAPPTPPSGSPAPPPPPPPPPTSASSAPASGEGNSLAAMLQARKETIIG